MQHNLSRHHEKLMQHNLWRGKMRDEFKDWLAESGKAKNTIDSYLLHVRQYMNWYLGTFGHEMTELLHSNILDYRSYLQTIKKQKASTVNAKLSALISFSNYLIETGLQKRPAVTKKDLVRIQSAYASPSDLSESEVEAFRQAVLLGSGIRSHVIVTILAYAGLRISEMLSLEITDIDCVGHEITVNRGKGNKQRVVFIGDKIVNAVKEYLNERSNESKWLFPGRYGKPLHRSVVNKLFSAYSDCITPHKLRHFYCSNALEKEYSLHEVANQAGHANIHTTLRYSGPKRVAMKDKANKL
jgi:site-specific recombinase XerD